MILKISMYFLSLMAVIFLNFAGASAASSGSELSCNAENGKKVFKKCAACHSVEKTDKHKSIHEDTSKFIINDNIKNKIHTVSIQYEFISLHYLVLGA